VDADGNQINIPDQSIIRATNAPPVGPEVVREDDPDQIFANKDLDSALLGKIIDPEGAKKEAKKYHVPFLIGFGASMLLGIIGVAIAILEDERAPISEIVFMPVGSFVSALMTGFFLALAVQSVDHLRRFQRLHMAYIIFVLVWLLVWFGGPNFARGRAGFSHSTFWMGGVISLLIASPILCVFLMALGLATRKKRGRDPALDQAESAEERLMDIEEELYGGNPPWKADDDSAELETEEPSLGEMKHSDVQANATAMQADRCSLDNKSPEGEKKESSELTEKLRLQERDTERETS
jgi:hypothetical protein